MYPAITAARRLQQEMTNRAVKDVGDMLFVGYTDTEADDDDSDSALKRS
jgi:hypothetical protein